MQIKPKYIIFNTHHYLQIMNHFDTIHLFQYLGKYLVKFNYLNRNNEFKSINFGENQDQGDIHYLQGVNILGFICKIELVEDFQQLIGDIHLDLVQFYRDNINEKLDIEFQNYHTHFHMINSIFIQEINYDVFNRLLFQENSYLQRMNQS